MNDRPIRHRAKHKLSLEERLLRSAREARDKARLLPPGREREMLLRTARQSEMAANIGSWIASPGLKPPE